MHNKLLEKQEQGKPKSNSWKEIIKFREEINKMETRTIIKRINGGWIWFKW
jgi:hypothetical protein